MKSLNTLGIYILIMLIITVFWQGYELYAFGELRPDVFHSIITVGFSASLTINYYFVKYIKED